MIVNQEAKVINMKFRQDKRFGKHPYVENDSTVFDKILAVCRSIDDKSRVISTRFGRVKTPLASYKLKINSNNPYEVFIQVNRNKWFQRFKIECSSNHKAVIMEK